MFMIALCILGSAVQVLLLCSQQPIMRHKISLHCLTKLSTYEKKEWQITDLFKCSDRVVTYTNPKAL